MKRIILSCLLLTALMACGRSDQPPAGSTSGGSEMTAAPLIYVPMTPRPTREIAPSFNPMINGQSIEIDTPKAGLVSHIAITMTPSQTIHLVSSLVNPPSFEWSVTYDVTAFVATTVDGTALPFIDGFTSYPAEGMVLTPTWQGTSIMHLLLRYEPCKGCEVVSTDTTYTITVQ
jgi:hypothetical protein